MSRITFFRNDAPYTPFLRSMGFRARLGSDSTKDSTDGMASTSGGGVGAGTTATGS